MTEPVPEVLRAVRGPEPLWAIEHRIGIDAQAREAIERARQPLGDVPREALAERAERLDDALTTFPHNRVEAAQRADQLSRLRDERREAHEHIGRAAGTAGPARPALAASSAGTERELTEQALASWTERAQDYDEQVAELARASTSTTTSAQPGSTDHGDEFIELAAAKVELRDRDGQARERRIDDIRRDPPAWVTERLGPRPDDPIAREQWDRAAAHLDDYRHAFGHPPGDEHPTAATTASATPGNRSTRPQPRPSKCTPSGPSSSAHRRSSPTTSASASADDDEPVELGARLRPAGRERSLRSWP